MVSSYIEEYKDLYHGTIEEYAKRIISAKKFTPSENGWCGKGVYFYDNRAKAWWSARRTRTVKRQNGDAAVATIVIADIKSLSKSYILDLRSSEDLKQFADFVDEFLAEFDFDIEEDLEESESRKLKRAMLLSFYCEEKGIKLIIGYF